MIYEHDEEMENISKKYKRAMYKRIIFFTIIWLVFMNGCFVLIIQADQCPSMSFNELFWTLPDSFFYNFKRC